MFFWYLVAMSGAWFIFFKFQENVFCFMPSLEKKVYSYYDEMLITVIITKIVSMIYKIYTQSSMRTFLVDWEPTKWYHEYSDPNFSKNNQGDR